MLKKFKHVKITGVSTVVPEDEINIYDEAQYYDNSVKKIDRMRKMVGFYKRRVADYNTTPADLAYNAAENLLSDLKIDRNTIDALVFVVQQPDVVNPASAYFLHDKLGFSDECIATDINQGCAGWVFGLYMVSQMIESGTHKRVLLLNGDTPSVGCDPADRNIAPIFGDGGVATLVEYSEDEIISYYNIETRSNGFEAIVSPFSGTRFRINLNKPEDRDLVLTLAGEKDEAVGGVLSGYMDGLAVFDFTIKVVPENIKALLKYSGYTQDDIDMLCLHQANKQIVQAVGIGADFGLEKVPYDAFENYGNNTMCSIPTTISLLQDDVKKDKLCVCGFGNGLICASAILNLEGAYILPIRNFVKPYYVKTREEYIEYWRNKKKGETNE